MSNGERFHVELAGDEVLVHDAHTRFIHRAHRRDISRALSGSGVPALDHLPLAAMPAIRAAIEPVAAGRRSILVGGGTLAAYGVLSTTLPFAAAAASLTLDPSSFPNEATLAGGSAGTINFGVGGGYYTYYELQGEESVQVLLGGTRGSANMDGIANANAIVQGATAGATVIATISNLPATGYLVFEGERGGQGGGQNTADLRGGNGGNAVGLYFWSGSGSATWLVVAAGAGGDSSTAPGGAPGQAGGGARPGGGARIAAGGTAGAKGSGGAPTAGGDADFSPSWASQNLPFPGGGGGFGTGNVGGGGGGAGFAGGGGGGDASTPSAPTSAGGGGGGGSVYVLEAAASGPYASAYSISTASFRDFTVSGSTLAYQIWTS